MILNRWWFRATAVAGVLGVVTAGVLSARSSTARELELARGRYLTHSVAICADCHGPTLMGGKLPFKPTVPIPNWKGSAPPIRGKYLKAIGVSGLTRLFMTGKIPGGKALGPPMPQFRMNSQDAHAVAVYLMSLK